MPLTPASVRYQILLIGGADSFVAVRAAELRDSGFWVWTVDTLQQLHWLMGMQAATPTVAIVDLPSEMVARGECVERMAAVASHAGCPCILIGGRSDDHLLFQGVQTVLLEADLVTLREAIRSTLAQSTPSPSIIAPMHESDLPPQSSD